MWFDRLLEGLLDTLLMVGVSSLIALLVQMIGAYVVTPAWAAYGPVGLVMPAVLLRMS